MFVLRIKIRQRGERYTSTTHVSEWFRYIYIKDNEEGSF